MIAQTLLLTLIAFPAVHAILLTLRAHFRRNLQPGDKVGVRLHEEVKTYEVVELRGDYVLVCNDWGGAYLIPRNEIYLPSHEE